MCSFWLSCVFSPSHSQTTKGVVSRLTSFCFCAPCSSERGFSSETVWVGMPPVCLSVCLLRCCSAPSSRLPLSTWARLLCNWSVVDGASFHVEPVVHFSLSKCCREGRFVWARGGNIWQRTKNIPLDCIKTCWLYLPLSDFQRKFCLCFSGVDQLVIAVSTMPLVLLWNHYWRSSRTHRNQDEST